MKACKYPSHVLIKYSMWPVSIEHRAPERQVQV